MDEDDNVGKCNAIKNDLDAIYDHITEGIRIWSKYDSVLETKEKGDLSISQTQAIIKLIEKKDRDRRFIKNWRPISLLNGDLKTISKALSEKLRKVLPDFISSQQTAYIKDKHIGESGRLISDVIEIAKIKKLERFLIAMDIEKAFDWSDHNFLILTLEKYGFGKNFILWVKILLRDQDSSVIKGGTRTKYFSLGRGAGQGDPISALLFILALKILFILIKSKPEIEGVTIFDYNYLYSAYADDATFFLKDIISIKHMVDTFHFCSYFSGIKLNLTKS